jgi:hypothetical protein
MSAERNPAAPFLTPEKRKPPDRGSGGSLFHPSGGGGWKLVLAPAVLGGTVAGAAPGALGGRVVPDDS